MPFLNGLPPQILVLRLRDGTTQGGWNEGDVLALLLVQLHQPLAPLGVGLLHRGRRLSLLAGFFPIPAATRGGWRGREERDEELSLRLRRKKMEERGERQVSRGALFFPTLKGEKRGRCTTLQMVTVLP